ncbi:MAG: DJ-1/PfpI family protein [Paludibacteraceae bacterium]|nr:DJ-1/PfpI family protein [Paludibacteraceae bacterium]
MKICIFLAEGFEEIEAVAPMDIFRRAGIEVLTISVTGNKVVSGAHSVPVVADVLFENMVFSNDDFLFLPGGLPGTTNLEKHEGLKNLIQQRYDSGGEIAAICAAPSIFGKMKLLADKEAICYPGFEQTLEGARLSQSKIVKADNVFTAKAAGVAIEFALSIVAHLKGDELSQSIREGIFL